MFRVTIVARAVAVLAAGLLVASAAPLEAGNIQGTDGYSPSRGGGGGKVLDRWTPPSSRSSGGGYTPPIIRIPNIQFPPPTSRQPRYNDYRNNSRDNRYYEPRQSTPRPVVRTVQPAVVKSNPKPPEKIVSTRANKKADFAMLEPIDSESHELLQDVANDHAQQSVDNVQKQLGKVADQPEVKEKLDELRDKIDAGEEITGEDIKELDELIAAVDPAAGLDRKELDILFDEVIFKSRDNADIQAMVFPPDGLGPGYPDGSVVMMPGLPQDEMMLLPGGGMLVGTGGQGDFGFAEQDARELLDLNLGIGEPEPDNDANVAKRTKSGTFLMNPKENGATINYVISNNSYSMKPGFTQPLPEGQTWVVRFDRGEGKDEATYTLSEGSYSFGESDGGWELFKQSFSVSIDNGDNDSPFYVNIDNTQEEVPAGAKREFGSEYPMLVRFDRGAGGEPAQKRIVKKSAHLVLAVNPNDGLWELYPESNFAGVARKSDKKISKLRQALLREKQRLSQPRASQ